MCAHDGECTPRLPLGAILADTHDRDDAGAARGFGLGLHLRIGLAVVSPPLGMTDNDGHSAGILEHFGRDVAGIGARSERVAVLATDFNARAERESRKTGN